MWVFCFFLIVLEKGQCFPELCLQDTDAFRYTDTGCNARVNALWLMPSAHCCSTLLHISCPSPSRGLQLSLIHDHAEGHVFSRPSGHTLFPLLSTFPHPLLFLHSNASQLSGLSLTFREITGTCSISPKSDGLSCQLLHCDYIYPFLYRSNSYLAQIFPAKDQPQ